MRTGLLVTVLAGLAAVTVTVAAQDAAPLQNGVPFRSGVELVNVTATVTNDDGQFVPDLTREDFSVFEDGQPLEIAYFASERVPVSLGILLDVSGSMTPDKTPSARPCQSRSEARTVRRRSSSSPTATTRAAKWPRDSSGR